MMRRHSKYKTPSFNLKFSAIFLVLFIFIQFFNKSHVMCESLLFPNLSINPDVYRFLPLPLRSSNQHFLKGSKSETPRDNGVPSGETGESGPISSTLEKFDPQRNLEALENSFDHIHPDMIYQNGGHKKLHYYYGDEPSHSNTNQQQDYAVGEQQKQQQFHKLLPTDFLFSKQLFQSSNPKIFNQANGGANGLMTDKEPSEEFDNSHLSPSSNYFNEFDIPTKQVAIRSKPSQFLLGGGLNSKRSQPSGYNMQMCHFKLCQLGASGKRHWGPTFPYD